VDQALTEKANKVRALRPMLRVLVADKNKNQAGDSLFRKLVAGGGISIVNLQCRRSYTDIIAGPASLRSMVFKLSPATGASLQFTPNFISVTSCHSLPDSGESGCLAYARRSKMAEIASVVAMCQHR
jgi:hypothetical protein